MTPMRGEPPRHSAMKPQPDLEHPSAPDLPVLPPAHTCVFPDPGGVRSLAMAPGEPLLYAQTSVRAVNLWPNVVGLWPEVLGGVVFVGACLLLLVVLRVRRRPRRPGLRYCRGCNYEISPGAGAVCPECGAAFSPSRRTTLSRFLRRSPLVPGSSFQRRVAVPFLAWLVLALIYASLLAFRLPRHGRADHWLDLTSATLLKYVDSPLLTWLNPKPIWGTRVVEIDARTGTIRRVITTRSDLYASPIALSPDGRAFFLARGDRMLRAFDIRSGAAINAASIPGARFSTRSGPPVLGGSRDGSVVYIHWMDRERPSGLFDSGVSSWRWRSGRPITMVTSDEYVGAGSGPVFLLRDHPGAHASEAAPRFLSRPSEAFRLHSVLSLYEQGRPVVRRTIDSMTRSLSFVPSADGESLYEYNDDLHLRRIDLDSGLVLEDSYVGEWDGPSTLSASADGRLLFLNAGGLLVYDIRARTWIARLVVPDALGMLDDVCVSEDRRWVAARFREIPTRPSPAQVAIWDLSALDHAPPESAPRDAGGR